MSTTIDYALVGAQYRKHRAALTRAKKKGPEDVVLACQRFVAAFDGNGWPWPDDWHRWNVAYGDAQHALGKGWGHHIDDLR